MEEIVWNIRFGKFNIRWKKVNSSPFIQREKGKDFRYFGIGKLAFVLYE